MEEDLQFTGSSKRCYEVEVTAIRGFNTNHLFPGDKLNDDSNTRDQIVRLTGTHMADLLTVLRLPAGPSHLVTLLEHWTALSEQAPDPNAPRCRS